MRPRSLADGSAGQQYRFVSGRAVTYGFNARGQVISIAVDGTTLLSGASYFPFGPIRQWTWANGQVMQREYDTDGRVASLTLGPAGGTYPDLAQAFGYDSLDRLESATLAAGQTQGFTYDANSNRLTSTLNAATTTYTYPSTSHRLSSLSGATTRSFTYDNAGNVTASQGITYVYDGRGRMKQAGTTTYLVSGLGQRVKKATGAVETYFAYDEAGRLIGEYDTSGATIQETIWLGDVPVGVIKPATPSGFTLFYIWADHLGTPRQITDAANQSRWEWSHTDPFGNSAANENPAGVGVFAFNLRFPGQYFDAETGKHYNYFRDYDPNIGRYLQSDPIGLDGGVNTYGYVNASPLTLFDEYGLAACCSQPKFDCVAKCVEKERFDLTTTLASLTTTLGIGTMPKQPNEMRGLGPRDKRNPYTSQGSRWQGRGGWDGGRAFGRSMLGRALGAAATASVVGEGFYDLGAIGRCIWVCTADSCAY